MDIKEIAKEMTREEFIKHIHHNWLVLDGEKYGCPSNIGLLSYGIIKGCHICRECWLNSIKDVKFKGEDRKIYKIWDVYNPENKDKKFKRLSDGEIYEFIGGCLTSNAYSEGDEYDDFSIEEDWELVQEPKQVSIEEAMKAFGENKKVTFMVRGEKFNYTGLNIQGGHYLNRYSINPLCKLTQFDVAEGIGPTLEHYFHEALIYGTWYVEG